MEGGGQVGTWKLVSAYELWESLEHTGPCKVAGRPGAVGGGSGEGIKLEKWVEKELLHSSSQL